MATNAAAVAIAMMNGGGGGSGGDVTRQYVDEHLALKVDKVEGKGLSTNDYTNADKSTVSNSPIADTITGINPTITNSADGYVQNIKIKGHTDSATAASVGDAGWGSLKLGTQDWYYDSEGNIFYTSTPDGSYNTPESSKQGGYNGYSTGYPVVTGIAYTEMPDKSIMLGPTQLSSSFRFVVKDTSFNGNLDAFKAATKDITVFYPLGNPALGSPLVGITTNNGAGIGTSAILTTGLPLCSVGDVKDELDEKRGVVVKRCEKTTEQGQEVIVPLATPVEIPITASELAQLRNLRTFENTTNITVTGNPTVDVGYLLDTGNGRAVGNIQQQFINTVPLSMIAPAFSTSETYAVGDFVIYNFMLYKCTTAVQTAGAWNAANWTASTVADMLMA